MRRPFLIDACAPEAAERVCGGEAGLELEPSSSLRLGAVTIISIRHIGEENSARHHLCRPRASALYKRAYVSALCGIAAIMAVAILEK